jgi:hypothetical protein
MEGMHPEGRITEGIPKPVRDASAGRVRTDGMHPEGRITVDMPQYGRREGMHTEGRITEEMPNLSNRAGGSGCIRGYALRE